VMNVIVMTNVMMSGAQRKGLVILLAAFAVYVLVRVH